MEQKNWFVYVVDHHEGPYSDDEVKKLLKKGECLSTSYVWKQGMADWAMLSNTPEFPEFNDKKGDGHGPASFVTESKTKNTATKNTNRNVIANGPSLDGVSQSDVVWCLNTRKGFSGPHSIKNLLRKINAGEVSPQDSVWKEGWASFVTLASIPDVANQIDADILSGKKKSSVKKFSAITKAIGLIGGASTRSYKWYRSTKFLVLFTILCAIGIYQGIALQLFSPIFEKASIKIPELTPIRFDNLLDHTSQIKNFSKPLLFKIYSGAPEFLKPYLFPVKLPEGLSLADSQKFKEQIATSVDQQIGITSALASGSSKNPYFYFATNFEKPLALTILLKGKPGTLVGNFSFEKKFFVELKDSIGKSTTLAGLPTGQYNLIAYESDDQAPETQEVLLRSRTKQKPVGIAKLVPENKKIFAVDSYFLGGANDPAYQDTLKNFNAQVRTNLDNEIINSQEILKTIETMANESAKKFFSLAGKGISPEWKNYHLQYMKMNSQLSSMVDLNKQKTKVLAQLSDELIRTFKLIEVLHDQQNKYILMPKPTDESMDQIRLTASQAVTLIRSTKAEIEETIKLKDSLK